MADHKITHSAPEIEGLETDKIDPEIASARHLEDEDGDLKKDHMDYDRVDREVAKYASAVAIDISPEENSRLKRLVDRRVLSIMIFTYFLQALDKGTMSFGEFSFHCS